MKTEASDKPRGMEGGIRKPRKPGHSWSYVLTYDEPQPAQRCNKCNKRFWVGAIPRESCDAKGCGGTLRYTREPRRVEVSGFETERAAKLARAKAVVALSKNELQADEKITLGEYLRRVWLPSLEAQGLKETTLDSYKRHVAHHLIGPASSPFPLATMRLTRVDLEAIREHYATLAAGYQMERVRTGKTRVVPQPGLAKSSVKRVHAVLHCALNAAVQRRLLSMNPAHGAGKRIVGAEGKTTKEILYWTPAELSRFLTYVADDGSMLGAMHTLWHLIAHTGMRRGEAIALQWGDIDLKAGTLTVQRNRVPLSRRDGRGRALVVETTPKTDRVRTIDLDDQTVRVLKAWHKRRRVALHLVSDGAYVFCDADGTPWHPTSVSWAFRTAIAACNADAKQQKPKALVITPMSIHGLRHTHATVALQAGVPVTVVSKRLGHSSVTMTLNVYSHVLRGADRQLASTFAEVVHNGRF